MSRTEFEAEEDVTRLLDQGRTMGKHASYVQSSVATRKISPNSIRLVRPQHATKSNTFAFNLQTSHN